MAQSQKDAASDNDVTPAGEETLDFDDDTLRGEKKRLDLFYQKISMYKPNKVQIPSPSVYYNTCCVLVARYSWIMNTEKGLRDSSHFTAFCELKARVRIYPRVNSIKLLQL